MTAEDFVDVRLTQAGQSVAGEGEEACVRVHGGNYDYCFKPGQAQRLPAGEFRARLEMVAMGGKALFEIVSSLQPAKAKRDSSAAKTAASE